MNASTPTSRDHKVSASDPKLPPGSNFCHCSGCGAYFLNVRAFDRHRVGPARDRACTAGPDMADAGLELDPRGYWRFPKGPAPKITKLEEQAA